MPDGDGISLMERAHAERPWLPVVMVTAHATVETALQALRRGAHHYLTKPVRWDERRAARGRSWPSTARRCRAS